MRTEGTGGASRALRVEENQLKYGETNIIITAKLFLDINKNIEDIKISLKYLERDIEKRVI